MSVYGTLSAVDVSGHIEKRGNLDYLSWAWAWAEVKARFPETTYRVYEREDGRIYWDDGRTCWVKTGVTIEGLEHIEYLPIMDARNRSIPVKDVTSFDVNKSIQRSLTKALARHGLGLSVYAGEDLPSSPEEADLKLVKAEPAKVPRVSVPAAVVTKQGAQKPDEPWSFKKAWTDFCNARNLATDRFSSIRQALVNAGIVPAVKSDDMTEESAKTLFDAIDRAMNGDIQLKPNEGVAS